MKKWILILLAIIIISTAFIYLFIPTSITVAGYKTVNSPTGSIARLFEKNKIVKKWWPGENINDSEFVIQETRYTIPKTKPLGSLVIKTSLNDLKVSGEINLIIIKSDSSAIEFQYDSFNSSLNPIDRIQYYFKALTLKKQVNLILDSLKQFAENKKNIYGIDVIETKVKDSSLISAKQMFNQYPTNEEIDDLIHKLKQHIVENGGIEKDFPMMNIRTTIDNKYDAMIAIPLLKDIPVKGDITIKKMILGNILEAKVYGGPTTIANAEIELKKYMIDHGKVSPAIPFQSLVTDRFKEQDTTKWITNLKYPIF